MDIKVVETPVLLLRQYSETVFSAMLTIISHTKLSEYLKYNLIILFSTQ